MSKGQRVKTIYAKELVELLRDRRTLIAMIVVPIALYPLLIIGSVHLLTVRDGTRMFEGIVVGVQRAPEEAGYRRPKVQIEGLLADARNIVRSEMAAGGAEEDDERLQSLERIAVEEFDDVRRAVEEGQCQVGVTCELGDRTGSEPPQDTITILYDKAEMGSEGALRRVEEAVSIVAEAQKQRNMAVLGVPPAALQPIRIVTTNVASPKKIGGMVLGSIVPLVLVLMTMTGAIYPAIDLTAGERERGTLETLIVAPVSPMELITGKYLVVTTIAMLGAALNLLSMGATLYFGGFTEMLSTRGDTELPYGVLPVILLALVPFALLFSAIMVAVCSYARTFKEAQNYIMPVILAALIPGGIAALPGTELEGVKTVVPVMNMVLMARELLLGHYQWAKIALVLLSTSLYAGAAVIIASRVFSTEAVVFADSASLRSAFVRRLMRPTVHPSLSLVLIVTALLFPAWMFVQFAAQPEGDETLLRTFTATAAWMPLMLVVLPAAVALYFKADLRRTFCLSRPGPRYLLAAGLIGAAAWVPAHELFVLQNAVAPAPKVVLESNAQMDAAFAGYSLWVPLLLVAVVPAVCEELFFRGFLLGGLGGAAGKWTALVAAAGIFGIFHFLLIKFALTAGLGLLLGYVCWQSRSIWPSIVAHLLHNGTAVLLALWPPYARALHLEGRGALDHLPLPVILGGIALVGIGVALCGRSGGRTHASESRAATV